MGIRQKVEADRVEGALDAAGHGFSWSSIQVKLDYAARLLEGMSEDNPSYRRLSARLDKQRAALFGYCRCGFVDAETSS